MFGTKLPSMTSRCSQSAPPRSASLICFSRSVKSAERIDGAIVIMSSVFWRVRCISILEDLLFLLPALLDEQVDGLPRRHELAGAGKLFDDRIRQEGR